MNTATTLRALMLAVLLPLLALVGATSVMAQEGGVTLSTDEINFGVLDAGLESASETFTITNTGTEGVTIHYIGICEGPCEEQYQEGLTVEPAEDLPVELVPGGSLDVLVTFDPEDATTLFNEIYIGYGAEQTGVGVSVVGAAILDMGDGDIRSVTEFGYGGPILGNGACFDLDNEEVNDGPPSGDFCLSERAESWYVDLEDSDGRRMAYVEEAYLDVGLSDANFGPGITSIEIDEALDSQVNAAVIVIQTDLGAYFAVGRFQYSNGSPGFFFGWRELEVEVEEPEPYDPARHYLTGPVLGELRDGEFSTQSDYWALTDDDGYAHMPVYECDFGPGDVAASKSSGISEECEEFPGDVVVGEAPAEFELEEVDDEDGVTFALSFTDEQEHEANKSNAEVITTPLLPMGLATSVTVELSSASSAFLNGWIDLNNDGEMSDEEHVIDDVQITSGTNVVPFDVPSDLETLSCLEETKSADYHFCDNVSMARFRVSSLQGLDVGGLAEDGEVEDYFAMVVNQEFLAENEVDVNFEGGSTLTVVGDEVEVRDDEGNLIATLPLGSGLNITLTGGPGDNTFVVDPAILLAGATINIQGGDGTDTIVIPEGTGSPATVVHTPSDGTSGEISVGAGTINYTGFEPIIDLSAPATHIEVFPTIGVDGNMVVMSPDGDGLLGDGISFLDSDNSESYAFANATFSVEIDLGDNGDRAVIGVLDTPLDAGFSLLDIDGGAGDDSLSVAPSSYDIVIDGGGEATTCSGDYLVVSGGTIDTWTVGGPTSGTITFSSGEADIDYFDVESFGNVALSIVISETELYSADNFYGDDSLVFTVTNSGPAPSTCLEIDLNALTDEMLAVVGTTSAGGGFAAGIWDIEDLEAGEEATLTLEGFVKSNTPVDIPVIAAMNGSGQVRATSNITIEPGFAFPAKTHINTAEYFSKTITYNSVLNPTTDTETYDQLIVGIFQGAPGFDTAVWCKIPVGITVEGEEFPELLGGSNAYFGERWRPCGKGLPYPLHPNDFHFDESTETLWLGTWGSGGLYKSEDGGETWEDAEPLLGPKLGWTNVYAITEDVASGQLYISANNGQVFRSLNGGDTWQLVQALPEASADTPWSMLACGTGNVFAGTFGRGVYHSDSYGFGWEFLEQTAGDNQDLIDSFGGHIFDMAMDDAESYLFAATATGVWRMPLDACEADGPWEQLTLEVTLDDASVVVPEVRSLVFLDASTDLVAGTWGFGAFQIDDPTAGSPMDFAPLLLKGTKISFLAYSGNGELFVGTDGGSHTFDLSGSSVSTTVEDEIAELDLPTEFVLNQNYPNPFNPVTTIGFALPETGNVRLAVYDLLGREVALLLSGNAQAGQHEVQFDAQSLPTGSYVYRLDTAQGSFTRQLVLMK